MITSIFNSVISFLGKQWSLLLSIGAGLIVLARVKDYVEGNAVSRAQKRELQNAIARIKRNKEFKDNYAEEVAAMDRVDIISIMRKNGEFRGISDE